MSRSGLDQRCARYSRYSRQRRAQISFNLLMYIPRIILLVVVLVACVILISLFLNNELKTKDIQAEMLVSGLIYSKGGVNYYDPLTGRNFPEVIDLSQFNSTEVDAALYYPEENRLIAAKVTVWDKDQNFLRLIYYNKKWYDRWAPLLKLSSVGGLGGVTYYSTKMPVLYKDSSDPNSILRSGYVKYEVIQPKG